MLILFGLFFICLGWLFQMFKVYDNRKEISNRFVGLYSFGVLFLIIDALKNDAYDIFWLNLFSFVMVALIIIKLMTIKKKVHVSLSESILGDFKAHNKKRKASKSKKVATKKVTSKKALPKTKKRASTAKKSVPKKTRVKMALAKNPKKVTKTTKKNTGKKR